MNNAPIGLFDSGMGGLSVWQEVRRGLPSESLIFFGDGVRCPYGSRPEAEVLQFTGQICHIASTEGYAVSTGHFCTLLDIRGQAAISIAHSLQQAQRHTLDVRGQNINIGIAI